MVGNCIHMSLPNVTTELLESVYQRHNGIDWLIIKKLLFRNIRKSEQSIIRTHEKKLRNLKKNRSNPFTHEEVVKNCSTKNLSFEELNIPKFGLNHSLPPLKLRKTNVFVSFEMIHRLLREDLKNDTDKPTLKAQLSHLANSYVYNYQPSRSTLTKHRILKKLRNDKEIVILRPDKGSGVVVLNRSDYEKSIKNLINDKTKFKELSEDVTIKRESKLQRFLRTLRNNKCLDKLEYEKIYPSGSSPAKIYGSPKMHKPFDSNSLPNFRPIVSYIGTYNYNLSKYLCELLSPNLPNEYCTKDTFTFVEELKEVSINDKFLVSFDVTSLCTNIPLKETIKLAVDLIKTSYPNLKTSSEDLTKLFKFVTCETHFLFNGKYYDQIDGVVMGSPLAPVLANLFMGHNEKLWIENFQGTPPSYYRRYVDDIFSVFSNSLEAKDTLTLSLLWRLELIKSFLF